MKLPLSLVQSVVPYRMPGYYEAVLAAGTVVGDQIELSESAWLDLKERFNRESDRWPFWALVVALFAREGDTGVGDTLRRELGGPKSERFKRWHESTFGLWSPPCGCGDKVVALNRLYPYPAAETAQSVPNPL